VSRHQDPLKKIDSTNLNAENFSCDYAQRNAWFNVALQRRQTVVHFFSLFDHVRLDGIRGFRGPWERPTGDCGPNPAARKLELETHDSARDARAARGRRLGAPAQWSVRVPGRPGGPPRSESESDGTGTQADHDKLGTEVSRAGTVGRARPGAAELPHSLSTVRRG
jgi:hypothetical protein